MTTGDQRLATGYTLRSSKPAGSVRCRVPVATNLVLPRSIGFAESRRRGTPVRPN
jgi:hypothetical protein